MKNGEAFLSGKLKKILSRKGSITRQEGAQLLAIIKRQDVHAIKEGSYYALCGKKYLLNNHQPKKARPLLSKAISSYPYRLDNYAFYMLSFFPKSFITWLHKTKSVKIQRT